MTDINTAAVNAAASASAPSAEAATIAAAVEATLMQERAATATPPVAKQAIAEGIYTAWRNKHLRGLSTAAFAQIEAAAPVLISAIAAQL